LFLFYYWELVLRQASERSEETLRELLAANWRVIIAIFIIALSVRLVYLARLNASPLFALPTMDAAVHDDWAYQLAEQGREPSSAPYFRAPLYAYFLSVFYRLGDRSPTGYLLMRCVQFLLGALSCVLIYILGRRFYSARAAVLSGLIAALYWPFIYFEGELLIPALLLPLILTGFVLFTEAVASERLVFFLASGLFFGLAAITRPNILLFFPVLLVWYAWPRKGERLEWKKLRSAAFLALVIALCIVPVSLRNIFVGKDVVLISSQAGVNFAIGNNQYADGKTAILPGTRATWWGGYMDSVRIAQEASGRELRPSGVSRFWFYRGLKFLFTSPGQAFKLYLKKLRYLFNNVEISNNKNIYFFRNLVGFINLPFLLGFSVVMPLALSGLIFIRRGRYRGLQLAFLAVYSLSILLFFVNGRFRLPMIPFLILAASAFVLDLWSQRRDIRAISLRLGVLFAFVAALRVISLELPPADVNGISDGHFMLANAYARQGKLDAARVNYRKGTKLKEPYRSRSYLGLGRIELLDGKAAAGEESLAEAWRLNPLVRHDVISVLLEESRVEAINLLLEKEVASAVERARYYLSLGDQFLRRRAYAAAANWYRKAIELDNSSPGAFVNLGNIYDVVDKDPQRAIAVYRQGLKYHPKNEALNYNLAETLKRSAGGN